MIMTILIQFTTALFLFVQTIGNSQTTNTETISQKQDSTLIKQNTKTEINTNKLADFIGTYFLAEADFNVEIKEDNNKMYIISPFSKDLLILKNRTTLHEITRGIDLELIKDDENALKYTQNGYETIIKRVNPNTEN
jgi:D-alanyl-D-alanine carboxypeptidase